ncbi:MULTISPECIES: four helix bundle protein [Pseudidiomarina]|uniref:four helix bundle protein n=1 Tax=Pseudidiomarina TaxID=2800384 RepID=UPI000D70FF6A|nr:MULTISPECIES: four helix bundle protein [Pseudidiomarina]
MAKELIVTKVAIELCCEIYRITRCFPKDEKYGLKSQMQRCAVSIPSNIEEGAHRGSSKDFLRFLFIARGSLAELKTQLRIAVRLGYIRTDENELLSRTYQLLNALINTLKLRIAERTNSAAYEQRSARTAQRTNNE